MSNRYRHLLPLALCTVLAMAACSTAKRDWASAIADNTVAGYQAFLDKHAGDPYSEEAKARIAALQEDSAWKTAQDGNSVLGYQTYLQAEPNGAHAQAARDEISGLERANAWKTAQSDGSTTALQAFLQQYPQGTESDQARQKLASIQSGYRAALGSFHDERAAQRKRAELRARFSKLLREVDVLAPDDSNKRYRVMSGLMDHQGADSACASLKRDHQTCEVVKADQGRS